MADLTEFSIVRSGTANVNTPTWSVSGKAIGDKGVVKADFSGVSFPQVLGTLTSAQQDEWAREAVLLALRIRFGL